MAAVRASDRLAILGAALLFSTGGVAIKWLSVGGWHVAGVRALFAAAAIALLVPGRLDLGRRGTWAVGAAQGASMLLFVLANKATTAANAIFLQCTAPLYSPFLASRLLGEHTSRRDLVAMAGIAVGLGCFFLGDDTPSATAPAPALGNALAVASGVAWAGTVVGLRYLAREGEGGPGSARGALLCGNLLVAAVAIPVAWPVTAAPTADWLGLAYLGTVQVALAYRLLVVGVTRVPALEASLLALFEPVLNPVWAFALLGERPSGLALVGAAVVAGVTLVRALFPVSSPAASPRR